MNVATLEGLEKWGHPGFVLFCLPYFTECPVLGPLHVVAGAAFPSGHGGIFRGVDGPHRALRPSIRPWTSSLSKLSDSVPLVVLCLLPPSGAPATWGGVSWLCGLPCPLNHHLPLAGPLQR